MSFKGIRDGSSRVLSILLLAGDDAARGVISDVEQDGAKGAGQGQGDGRLDGEIAKHVHGFLFSLSVRFLILALYWRVGLFLGFVRRKGAFALASPASGRREICTL